MSQQWLGMTPWELAFLAGATPTETTLLDQLSSTGLWLRRPEIQEVGATLLAERRRLMPEDQGESFWASVIVAARLLVVARQGSALLLHGAQADVVLVTAAANDLISQLWMGPNGVALRLMARPLPVAELVRDLRSSGMTASTTSADVVSWSADGGRKHLPWGSPDPETGGFLADDQAALTTLCSVALGGVDT